MYRIVLNSFVAVLVTTSAAWADVELPSVFSDHMVLQRDQPIKVWGWAGAGESIECSLAGKTAHVKTNADGEWSLTIDRLKAGGPHTLSLKGSEHVLEVKDVYIGEVWLCSGQSNMAMTVSRAMNPKQEAADAKYPLIRMFKVSSAHASEPQERCKGVWTVCSPETVGSFSATAYFFGRRLHRDLNVPIGLINSSVGGTAIESWTSMSAQESNPNVAPVLKSWKQKNDLHDDAAAKAAYEQALAAWEKKLATAKQKSRRAPRKPALAAPPSKDKNYPSNLFNGKIHALVGYTIRGAIWYQGERNSNTNLPHLYDHQLETLISDWRSRWGQGDFPFAWAQLPNFRKLQTQPSETTGWVLVREGMLKALRIPNTGMAITVDVGEATDIHPKNKQVVGSRLARWALGEVYRRSKELPGSPDAMGPIYESAQRDGKRMRIRFQYVGDQLPESDEPLKGFAIAGKDRQFHWADAKIRGNFVEVWSDAVPEPEAVRYNWAENPIGNLVNEAGIPASPFRTDDWDR